MSSGDQRDVIDGDQLWDSNGQLWIRRHPAWLTAREAGRWVRRGQPIALYLTEDLIGTRGQVRWLHGEHALAWWAKAEPHLEIPGRGQHGDPDEDGRTWGAHLWRHAQERRVGFTGFC